MSAVVGDDKKFFKTCSKANIKKVTVNEAVKTKPYQQETDRRIYNIRDRDLSGNHDYVHYRPGLASLILNEASVILYLKKKEINFSSVPNNKL